MSAKSDNRTRRREQIFEAAIKVIAEKGFHGATIKEIARAAGLGKGTIYQYIRKKEDLLILIVEEGVSLMAGRISKVCEAPDAPERKLRRVVDAMLDLIEEHSMLAKTLAMEIERIKDKDTRQLEEIYEEKFLSVIRSQIEDVPPGGGSAPGDAMVTAEILTAMCFLWSHSELLRRHAGDVETYKRILTQLFLHGLTGREEEATHG
jgi:AcrR family transcriptional regulator